MLYVLRHGKTDWNREHRLQGRTDIPLNEEGRAMARQAAREYKDVHFDVCYCSPLVRARETADLVLEGRNIPIIEDDRLKEMSFGKYEGLVNCFENPQFSINLLFHEPEKYVPDQDGGESLEELYERTGAFLREVALPAVEEGKDVLIVGHGAMNSSIICQVKNKPVKDFWTDGIENCKLKKLL